MLTLSLTNDSSWGVLGSPEELSERKNGVIPVIQAAEAEGLLESRNLRSAQATY